MQIRRSPSRNQAAMTLMEMMIATAIGSTLMMVLAILASYTARSFAAISNYQELDKQSRRALDQMSAMVRESDGLTSFSSNRIVLSFHGNSLTYAYNADQKTLTEYNNGVNTVLLKGCESFIFGIYQRNTIGGTYDQYPASLDNTSAKIIQVSWVCSRKLISSLVNTESIQSAKIVIRKQ